MRNYFIRLAPRRILFSLLPLFSFSKHVDGSVKGKRSEDMRDSGIFLFYKDTISLQRVQGYASEEVSCCALCCLFNVSQLITFAVERYGLQTVNTTILSVQHCKLASLQWCGVISVLSYTHFLLCKCPLHTLERSCNMIIAEVVPAVARALQHCVCPLDCLTKHIYQQH